MMASCIYTLILQRINDSNNYSSQTIDHTIVLVITMMVFLLDTEIIISNPNVEISEKSNQIPPFFFIKEFLY